MDIRSRTISALILGAAMLGACSQPEPPINPDVEIRAKLEAYVENTTYGYLKPHLMAYAATYNAMVSAKDEATFGEAFEEMPKQEACLFVQFGKNAFTFSRQIRNIVSQGNGRRRNQARYFKLMQNSQPFHMSEGIDPCL